jgi:hypothetical protein
MIRGEDGRLHPAVESDKYKLDSVADVDCASRIHACGALCCRLPFALSAQDLAEGIIRFDPAEPYLIQQDEDGRCMHQDTETGFCSVHTHRPAPCRIFDCHDDERIWLDYERCIINPAIHNKNWPFGFISDG